MITLALLLIGFSIFSAALLALGHFRPERYQDNALSRISGLFLLLILSGLQFAHFNWLYFDREWVQTLPYHLALFSVAPAFFLFTRPLLNPRFSPTLNPLSFGHVAPVLIGPTLPPDLVLPIAFIIGSGYLGWLARDLYSLRAERESYQLEIMLLGSIFIIAFIVSLLGFAIESLPGKLFFTLYSISIGLAFFLVQTTLNFRPQLTAEIKESAISTYSVSTLNNIDCDSKLFQLDRLMKSDLLYEDSKLSLPVLAERLEMTAHQLSELINANLGKSFSRYLREIRINAAKSLLCSEPVSSILSIGISVGFTSQSNFYEAFNEIEGMTPGKYRKLHGDKR